MGARISMALLGLPMTNAPRLALADTRSASRMTIMDERWFRAAAPTAAR